MSLKNKILYVILIIFSAIFLIGGMYTICYLENILQDSHKITYNDNNPYKDTVFEYLK